MAIWLDVTRYMNNLVWTAQWCGSEDLRHAVWKASAMVKSSNVSAQHRSPCYLMGRSSLRRSQSEHSRFPLNKQPRKSSVKEIFQFKSACSIRENLKLINVGNITLIKGRRNRNTSWKSARIVQNYKKKYRQNKLQFELVKFNRTADSESADSLTLSLQCALKRDVAYILFFLPGFLIILSVKSQKSKKWIQKEEENPGWKFGSLIMNAKAGTGRKWGSGFLCAARFVRTKLLLCTST